MLRATNKAKALPYIKNNGQTSAQLVTGFDAIRIVKKNIERDEVLLNFLRNK